MSEIAIEYLELLEDLRMRKCDKDEYYKLISKSTRLRRRCYKNNILDIPTLTEWRLLNDEKRKEILASKFNILK